MQGPAHAILGQADNKRLSRARSLSLPPPPPRRIPINDTQAPFPRLDFRIKPTKRRAWRPSRRAIPRTPRQIKPECRFNESTAPAKTTIPPSDSANRHGPQTMPECRFKIDCTFKGLGMRNGSHYSKKCKTIPLISAVAAAPTARWSKQWNPRVDLVLTSSLY
jgi:hypothetical protein